MTGKGTIVEAQNDIDISEQDKLWTLLDFIEHFNIHYRLLLKRYERFKEINDKYNADIDSATYFDLIIVQLRAMCIENPKYQKNYTAQNFLRMTGRSKQADAIDAMLNESIPLSLESNITIRIAVKTLADKIICHYDNFDGEKGFDWSFAHIIETYLKNPYADVNLDYIMKTVTDCLGEGLVYCSIEK